MKTKSKLRITLHLSKELLTGNLDYRRLELDFRNALEREVKMLMDGLGIPDHWITLEIEFNNKESALWIGGSCQPVTFNKHKPFERDQSLINALYHDIFNNRKYIITQGVAEAISIYYLADNIFPIDILTDFLQRLAYHGIKFEKPLELFQKIYTLNQEKPWLESQIEIILATCAKDEVKILHSGGLDIDKDLIKAQIFNQYGFLPENIKLEESTGLEPNHFRVFLNDVPCRWNVYTSEEDVINELTGLLDAFFHMGHMDRIFGRLRKVYPMVIFNATEKYGSVRLVKILRRLLEEKISIKDIRGIVGSLLEITDYYEEEELEGKGELILPYGVNLMKVEDKTKPKIEEYITYIQECGFVKKSSLIPTP